LWSNELRPLTAVPVVSPQPSLAGPDVTIPPSSIVLAIQGPRRATCRTGNEADGNAMDGRLHRALDGELAVSDLTDEEQEHLLEAEAAIRAVLSALPQRPLPDLAPAVLRSIEKAERERDAAARVHPRAGVRGLLTWLWRPRPISIGWRPVYSFGAGAALLVLLALALLRFDAPVAPRQVFTEFVLHAPDAHEVTLAGDFTGWKPSHPLTRSGPGVWTVVVPLDPGIHHYAFVVDGEQWVPDPMAPAYDDGFGGRNSRLAVLAPEEVSR
jgi:hypothetical protein